MSAPSLTVVVLTKNEEQNIVDCLASASWADGLVVFDSLSEDRTVALAQMVGATVLERPFRNYADQRNAALDQVTGDWVFFLDADERATPELAEEIRRVIAQEDRVGWWVPRRNYIWGKWIKHAGWSPDYQLRLLRRGRARYDPAREVHEVVVLDGAEGYLENPLTHYNYQTLGQFMRKQERYMAYEVQILHKQGVRTRLYKFASQPLKEFWRRYVTLEGYKDGMHGLVLSALMGYYMFRAYQHLRKLPA